MFWTPSCNISGLIFAESKKYFCKTRLEKEKIIDKIIEENEYRLIVY